MRRTLARKIRGIDNLMIGVAGTSSMSLIGASDKL